MACEAETKCPLEYYFVVHERDEDIPSRKFRVLRKFHITSYKSHNMQACGQYISSLNYQTKNKIGHSLEFYIVGMMKGAMLNKKFIQSIFDSDISDIYHKCCEVYYFNITDSELLNEYKKVSIEHKQNESSHEHRAIKVSSTDRKCVLTIHMLVTDELLNEDKYLLNNPSFEVY